jgi:hypothetical protein
MPGKRNTWMLSSSRIEFDDDGESAFLVENEFWLPDKPLILKIVSRNPAQLWHGLYTDLGFSSSPICAGRATEGNRQR